MKKDYEVLKKHKDYLRAKSALRDQHQDDYAFMLERHAQELDNLWAQYNLAVRKLAEAHSTNSPQSSNVLPMKEISKKAKQRRTATNRESYVPVTQPALAVESVRMA